MTSGRADIVSDQVDLTAVPLAELTLLKSPELDSAVARLTATLQGSQLGEGVQEQRWVEPS